MTTIREALGAVAAFRPAGARQAEDSRSRTRRRIGQLVTLAVGAWSTVEIVNLALNHTEGAELYGVLVAALAVTAAVLNIALLATPGMRPWATAAVLALWAVIALGGVAGTVAHVIGPVADHGPVDVRPRPIVAPLIFTALGLVGAVALFFGQRTGLTRPAKPDHEA